MPTGILFYVKREGLLSRTHCKIPPQLLQRKISGYKILVDMARLYEQFVVAWLHAHLPSKSTTCAAS
jgi:hypothetical protein